MNYSFFEDKQVINPNKIPKEIYARLMAIGGLDISDNNVKIAFCGIIVSDECTYCFFPTKSSERNPQAINTLIKVIHSYNLSVNSSLLIHDEDDQGNIIEDISLASIIEILDLFFNTGILRSKKFIHSEKGKVNWPKTINRDFPIVANNVPIYIDPHKHPIPIYQDDLITSIHCEVILDLQDKFYWLDDRFEFLSKNQLSERISPTKLSIDQKILLLKQRLYSTFVSLEIRVLQLLIKYLERIKEEGSCNIVIGIRKFHFVWEFLLKNIFHDVDHKINSILPIPQYFYSDPNQAPYNSAEKGMRIDIFIKKDNHCWVIDSKYYLAVNPQTAPGWSDLVKQFFYVKAIKLLYPEVEDCNIKNIFIFPGSNNVLSKIQMTYRHENQNIEQLKLLTNDFVPIECLYLDPSDVMESFINARKIDIKNLCNA